MKKTCLILLLFCCCGTPMRAQFFFRDTLKGTFTHPFLDSIKAKKHPLPADTFLISDQVSLGDYKKYLSSVKKDSSEKFFIKQLPDSSVMSKADYRVYLNTDKYDKWPVVGISWYAAINYCIWKTRIEFGYKPSYYYCLPTAAQWNGAKEFFDGQKNVVFSQELFSDWLLDAMDESVYQFENALNNSSYLYFGDTLSESKVLLRKTTIGNNWQYQFKHVSDFLHCYGYGTRGYATLSFRLVKLRTSNDAYLSKWGLVKKRKPNRP